MPIFRDDYSSTLLDAVERPGGFVELNVDALKGIPRHPRNYGSMPQETLDLTAPRAYTIEPIVIEAMTVGEVLTVPPRPEGEIEK